MLDLVNRILRAMGSKLEPLVLNQASNEIRRQYLSAERARQAARWSPLFTLDTGIERAISWYRDFLGGAAMRLPRKAARRDSAAGGAILRRNLRRQAVSWKAKAACRLRAAFSMAPRCACWWIPRWISGLPRAGLPTASSMNSRAGWASASASLVNSGSSANLLAVSALTSPKLGERRLLPGDEVITVAAGFPTTVNPIFQNGLVPVFVDVAVPTYNVDVTSTGSGALLTHARGHAGAHSGQSVRPAMR